MVEIARRLSAAGVQSLTVCLLHSYANPRHEERLRAAIEEALPELPVTLSSEVLPQFREYERASTTVMNAYVKPVIDRYIGRIEDRMQDYAIPRLWIMQSNGGAMPAAMARQHAARTLLSGPAAGVTGATHPAKQAGFPNIMTLDMGGTSTDVCLVQNNQPVVSAECKIDGLPLKISVTRDWIEQGTVRDLLLANSRLPHLMLGDMSAQFSANRTGAARLEALARRYGKQTLLETVEALLDYSEQRTRSAIRSIPAGRYVGEERLELDPLSNEPAHIVATVEVREDELDIDFSGTSEQVAGPVNSPLASTMSAVYAAIRVFLRDRSIPYNDGCTRPVRVTVPLGSLLNPRYPAALRARMNAAYRAHGAVARALGLALPERAVAPGYDSASMVTLSYSPMDGKYEIFQDMVQGGGTGAGPNHDGVDAVGGPMTSSRNTPVESAELDFGFIRIVRSELAPDSGGAGQYRGGLGVRRDYEVLRDGMIYSGFTARGRFPAEGANGGRAGGTGGMRVIRDGKTIDLPSTGRFVLQRGDILSTLAAGGGGFGDPVLRERSLVERDLREGKISVEGARAFGVGII